jgi:hypothetical protein
MKPSILIILCGHEMDPYHIPNIQILKEFIGRLSIQYDVDVACISSNNDFNNYEQIIQFKYKIINTKKQMGKICDFISDNKYKMTYDWYLKIRPDMVLIDDIDFNKLCMDSINARARVYTGMEKIEYGCSIGGKGEWQFNENTYSENHTHVILDDQIFIFHKNIIHGFDYLSSSEEEERHNEWFHTSIWKKRNINLKIIGINTILKRQNGFYNTSGHINL